MYDRVAVLAHEKFPDRSKTANGILRYADYEVAAVLDRDRPGERVADHLPGVADAPVVSSFADVPGDVDALVIGVAPIGGGFDESWRPDMAAAIEAGCDVVSASTFGTSGSHTTTSPSRRDARTRSTPT